MATTADSLVDKVKTTITVPDNQVLLTNERILEFINEEIDSEMVPLISSVNQDYFVAVENESLTAGESTYAIPYRAIGRALRDLKINDGSNVRSISKIPLEDAHLFRSASIPQSFYFMGDKIVLVPTPLGNNTLSLDKYYLSKPNRLVLLSEAGKITNISGTTLTLDNVPTDFTTSSLLDLIEGKQGHQNKAMDVAVVSVSGNQVEISAAPTGFNALAVGDYVATACESPVLQLPDEAVPLLVFRTAKRCLEALGDYEGSEAIDKEITKRKKQLERLIAPRAEGASTKIMQRFGLLRGYRGRYGRGIVY
jgi:hypothetical protein